MPRLDDLPADQKATLQLLLKQGKGYDDIAALLRIEPGAVRERALDALDALGPETAAGLSPSRQDELSDFLLGQQPASQRAATREFLEGSAAGRAWARAVAGELRPLAGDALPEIPAEGAEVEEAFEALEARKESRERQQQSSKLGGLLVVAAVLIVLALVGIALATRGGDDPADQAADTPTATSTTAGAAAGSDAQVEAQVNLTSTRRPSTLAVAYLLNRGGQRELGVLGQGFLPTEKKFTYAVWLYTSPSKATRLGFVSSGVGTSGRLTTGASPSQLEQAAAASKDAGQKQQLAGAAKTLRDQLSRFFDYDSVVITRETKAEATRPGPIVVSGKITRGSGGGAAPGTQTTG